MVGGYQNRYCRMVPLTDTSVCLEWRNEPRKLVAGSPSSAELAGALKSKSRSLPDLLIAQAQLANIAILPANRIRHVTPTSRKQIIHDLASNVRLPDQPLCLRT